MSVKKLNGKIARRVRTLTASTEPEIQVSGPGAFHVGTCEICNNQTQVAQWLEKSGRLVTACQLCID